MMKRWILAVMMMAAILPVAAWAEETTGDEAEIGWFGMMRAKMLARHYEIDETTAIRLQRIIHDEGMEEKRLNNEVKMLLAELDAAVKGQAGARSMTALFNEIKARKSALGVLENATLDRVVDLLGQEKAARWLLSRRGMMDRVTGNFRQSSSSDEGEEAAPEPARAARSRRSGSY